MVVLQVVEEVRRCLHWQAMVPHLTWCRRERGVTGPGGIPEQGLDWQGETGKLVT